MADIYKKFPDFGINDNDLAELDRLYNSIRGRIGSLVFTSYLDSRKYIDKLYLSAKYKRQNTVYDRAYKNIIDSGYLYTTNLNVIKPNSKLILVSDFTYSVFRITSPHLYFRVDPKKFIDISVVSNFLFESVKHAIQYLSDCFNGNIDEDFLNKTIGEFEYDWYSERNNFESKVIIYLMFRKLCEHVQINYKVLAKLALDSSD